MNSLIYLNDDEVVELIANELNFLNEANVDEQTFRYTHDTLSRIMEGLNNVSSIVVEDGEIIL